MEEDINKSNKEDGGGVKAPLIEEELKDGDQVDGQEQMIVHPPPNSNLRSESIINLLKDNRNFLRKNTTQKLDEYETKVSEFETNM